MYAIRSYYGQSLTPSNQDKIDVTNTDQFVTIKGQIECSYDQDKVDFKHMRVTLITLDQVYSTFTQEDGKYSMKVPKNIIGRITSYNVCYTKLLRSFLKNFWFDDLLFFGEASFLLAIKPFLENSPTSWYKRFIYFDGEELIVNRLGVSSKSINLNDVVSFEDRDKKSSKSYLTFTHKDGSTTRIPWLLGHEIKETDENTINGLLVLIQKRIDKNINQTFFLNPANVS